jgi:hypothetical protein
MTECGQFWKTRPEEAPAVEDASCEPIEEPVKDLVDSVNVGKARV